MGSAQARARFESPERWWSGSDLGELETPALFASETDVGGRLRRGLRDGNDHLRRVDPGLVLLCLAPAGGILRIEHEDPMATIGIE